MVDAAIGIVATRGSWAEMHLPIKVGRRIPIRWTADSGHDVSKEIALDTRDVADSSVAKQFLGLLIVRRTALLCSHLHDALVFRRYLLHPFTFADEKMCRLFDIHILTRRASHHRLQRMPMVRCGDDHCVHVLAL